MLISLTSNIPIPDSRVRREYPYEVMGVGDSFLIEGVSLQSVCNSNYRASKKYGIKLIARRIEEEGVRVWRTA